MKLSKIAVLSLISLVSLTTLALLSSASAQSLRLVNLTSERGLVEFSVGQKVAAADIGPGKASEFVAAPKGVQTITVMRQGGWVVSASLDLPTDKQVTLVLYRDPSSSLQRLASFMESAAIDAPSGQVRIRIYNLSSPNYIPLAIPTLKLPKLASSESGLAFVAKDAGNWSVEHFDRRIEILKLGTFAKNTSVFLLERKDANDNSQANSQIVTE